MAIALQEKARELGQRLAQSTVPDELKREVLADLPAMQPRDIDLLLFALRAEHAQLALLEHALKEFEETEGARVDDAIAGATDAAITAYVERVQQDAARRSLGTT